MKILILDDVEMSESQRQRLEALGDLREFSGLPTGQKEIIDRAGDAEILVVGWTKIDQAILRCSGPAVSHIR